MKRASESSPTRRTIRETFMIVDGASPDAKFPLTPEMLAEVAALERRRHELCRTAPKSSSMKMRWRARITRDFLHICPGDSILFCAAGDGEWTHHLSAVTKARNPISAITFDEALREAAARRATPGVEVLSASELSDLPDHSFDFVVGGSILTTANCEAVFATLFRLLRPGGSMLLFETNHQNPLFVVRRWFREASITKGVLLGALQRTGFVDCRLQPYDMVPLTMSPDVIRTTKSKLLVFEHVPWLRTFCGTTLVNCRRPGPIASKTPRSLAEHTNLYGRISVVIPCFNEEMNLERIVNALFAMYGPYIHELLFVNDNSTDRTAEVAGELAKTEPRVKLLNRRPPNGVGLALKAGYEAATGDYILSMDCDFVSLLPDLRPMFDHIAAGGDGAIGSRFSHDSVLVDYPWMKAVGNRSVHLLIKLLFPIRVRDISNNLKLYRGDILRNMTIREPHFAANLEIGLKSLLAGHNIKEVPVSWIGRSEGMGSSSFKLFRVGPPYLRVLGRALWSRLRPGSR